jgi:hypothetical protein
VNPVQHVYSVVNYELVVEAKETENSEHHLSCLSTSHCPTDTLKQGLTNPRCQVTSNTKYYVVYTVHFLIFHSFKNQQNALMTLQSHRSQNTLLIRCQLLHVLAPRCHPQGVTQQQKFVGPTSISGTICPYLHNKS